MSRPANIGNAIMVASEHGEAFTEADANECLVDIMFIIGRQCEDWSARLGMATLARAVASPLSYSTYSLSKLPNRSTLAHEPSGS